ncbi:MAG: UvrD-helicase domain-containing protein, partial [Actinomyces massiliensis]
MNATNSLFGALPMPGHGSDPTPPPEAALPTLSPADDWPEDSWADTEPPDADEGDGYDDPDVFVPSQQDQAEADAWENRQHEAAALVARAQASAAAARARSGEAGTVPSSPSSYGPGSPARGVTVADPADLLTGLNPAQGRAVTHSGSPLLIIDGAGSGKTRVLTHRIAHPLATGRARPGVILAIT